MNSMRDRWNQRYQSSNVPNQVIDILALNQHLLPSQGKSLDLACGLGGNALRMAELGFNSHAWDISDIALNKIQEFSQERLLQVECKQCDISLSETQQILAQEQFDVIIVSHFLLREITNELISALAPGGLIFYQTFVDDPDDVDHGDKPNNSSFRLKQNELLHLFSDLTLRFYREDGHQGDPEKGLRDVAMIVAQKV